MKLFEITDEMLRALDTLVDSDGEITPESEAALAELQKVEASKLDGYFYAIKKLEMEAAAAQAQLDQWKKKAESRKKAIEWMKAAVKTHLETVGADKVVTNNGNTFAVQKNGGKRPIVYPGGELDPINLPEEYTVVKVEVNTEKIRKELEAGIPLAFAELAEAGTHLRLR